MSRLPVLLLLITGILSAARKPRDCWREAQKIAALPDKKQQAKSRQLEQHLYCAIEVENLEAQYLLGLVLLQRTAAEDEPHRFEGFARVVLAARGGYAPAVRRWERLAQDLIAEELEMVEQKAKQLSGAL